MSSPMILAYNLSEPARRNLVWDIITNKEAIQVSQTWAGHPGAQVHKESLARCVDSLSNLCC